MPQSPARRKTAKALRILTTINISFLILLFFAQAFVAERHWFTTFITYIPQHPFGIPTAALLLWSILRRDRRALTLNAAAALFFLFALMGFNIPWRSLTRPSGTPVRVMTYNIHHGSHGADEIAKAIVNSNADIVCLQEANANTRWPRDPLPQLAKRLPDWHLASGGEIATFSRYPVLGQEFHRLSSKTTRGVLVTKLRAKGRDITIINTHFAAGADPELVSRSEPGRSYVQESADVRMEEATTLLDVASSVDGPLLIAGDFNVPPRGLVYRRIASRYRDAFRCAGWGLGHTFRTFPSVLRIDFVFTNSGLEAISCSVNRSSASDHRPVVADLLIATQETSPCKRKE